MPTFRQYTLLLTDGAEPNAPAQEGFGITRLSEVPPLDPQGELFGPWADRAVNGLRNAQAAFLLHGKREGTRQAEGFFAQAQAVLTQAVKGMTGWGVDVLKLWPFPLDEVVNLPEEPLSEDLFSVGFYEKGSGRFRAETFGLAKLDQAEITFEFVGQDLLDEAALLCAHLADYVMSQSRRAVAGQEMSFGFDRIAILAPEDGGEGSLRRWHPTFVQRSLSPGLFPGVGLLEVRGFAPGGTTPHIGLTELLRRSFEQRLELERQAVSGESPHEASQVRVCPCAGGANGLRGYRVDPETVRESGWVFTCTARSHAPEDLPQRTLGELAKSRPEIVRYLALPPGTTLEWSGRQVAVTTRQSNDGEDPEVAL